jgi:hypothetical protein
MWYGYGASCSPSSVLMCVQPVDDTTVRCCLVWFTIGCCLLLLVPSTK